MALAHFSILIHEFLNKDTDIVPKEATLNIYDSKYAVCISNKGKDTKHTKHIARRVKSVRNSEKYKINNIKWCEEGLKLADMATKNVGENYLNPRMKYIMLRLDNWHRTLVQEGWQDIG